MSPHRRPPGAPDPAATPDDELAARITGALHRRAAAAPDPAAVADRLAAALARRTSPRVVAVRRGGQVLAAGVVTGSIAVGAAGAAAATNPYSPVAVAFEDAARTVGFDVSFMPPGYTREQDAALWGAGYEMEEIDALAALWGTDVIETKSRIGQMLIDGEEVPVPPDSVPDHNPGEDQYEAFFDAGYTFDDLAVLAQMWGVGQFDAKLRAGQAVLDGETLPIAPGSAQPGATPLPSQSAPPVVPPTVTAPQGTDPGD